VAEYQVMLEKLFGKALGGVEVTFSQGSELPSLLSRAAVAVTHSSTVFLDCITRRSDRPHRKRRLGFRAFFIL